MQDSISRVLCGLLGIGFGLLEVSNTSKLVVEGMNPKYKCYVFGVEVTHMLDDGRVGVHRVNYDSVVSVVLCSYLILSLCMIFLCASVIEL